MPAVSLRPGLFSDTGYRFRKNIFERIDNWVPGFSEIKNKFYDIRLYNSDQIVVGKNYMKVLDAYFRIDIDEILHQREVYRLFNWIAAIGGI